jgi:5-formyltetrahydrofolate cyclo-ligase
MKIVAEKKGLRAAIKLQRDAIDLDYKLAYDTWICNALEILIAERNCNVVHAYLPMGNEIDILPLIEKLVQNKSTVVVPKTLKKRKLEHLVLNSLDDLEPGVYGTSHPKDGIVFTGEIDLIIVPGLAFDSNNYRLGYGGGYYDAFLAEHPNAYTVGVCYPFQKLKTVPKEAHDACLNTVCMHAFV